MAKHPVLPSVPFAPRPSRIETKADATNSAARSIIQAEADKQAAKTAKLRALRLASQPDEPAPAKPKRAPRKATASR